MLEVDIQKILPVIRQYPASIQLAMLKYYLIYLLKDNSKEQVVSQCERLQNTLFVVEESNSKKDIDDIALLLGIKLSPQQTGNQNLNQIKMVLEDLKHDLQGSALEKNKGAVIDLVKQLYGNDLNIQTVINDSAQEMFDRIFDSLDPAKAENHLDQSVRREGVEYKAALYDAMCEKHEQLLDYHHTGRMLKDFRRAYKTKLKDKQGKDENSNG